MTTPRIKTKNKNKRKLTSRKRTRQRDGAAFSGPILASADGPVLNGIIGKFFRMMYVKKKKAARRKTKKSYRTRRRRYQKGGFVDPFAPFKIIEKMMGF